MAFDRIRMAWHAGCSNAIQRRQTVMDGFVGGGDDGGRSLRVQVDKGKDEPAILCWVAVWTDAWAHVMRAVCARMVRHSAAYDKVVCTLIGGSTTMSVDGWGMCA
jgi:hypothetical protein